MTATAGAGAAKKSGSRWEFMQGLGKTFMLPVALLAFCGIMLGVGLAELVEHPREGLQEYADRLAGHLPAEHAGELDEGGVDPCVG